jgi:uncharacterized protein YukE
MATLTDFSSLDHAAIALGDHAQDLRAQVARLRAATEAVQWHSSAASAFRHRSDEVCASLTQCAAGLDAAALELRQHAATARSRLRDVAGPVLTGVDAVVDTGSAIWHALT